MKVVRADHKYLRKNKSYSKNNINIFNKDTIPGNEGGISESRLINNNSNIQTIMNILKCKICKNILLNPYDCSKCGNTFCYQCINKLKENHLPCPFNCLLFEITPSSYGIKKFLNQLKFECKYKSDGCKEIISYTNVETHENNCPYHLQSCPNEGCKQKIKKIDLENHIKNECQFTLFQCENCGLKLNRKEIIYHDRICSEIKNQLDSQSPIINNFTEEEYIKNNKNFNSFMNILNELNEDYFYLFDKNKSNNYYYNYSNKGLITLIKCLIYLFQYKFGQLENQLNNIDNNIKKISKENFQTISKASSSIFDYSIKKKQTTPIIKKEIKKKKLNKINIPQEYIKTEKIIKSQNKNFENYNSENINKKYDTLNLENEKLRQKILINNLYNKDKNDELFHNRQKSDISPNIFLNNHNYIKNELFSFGEKIQHKNINISRNRAQIRPNMTFTNFIIHKKRDIEQKISGKKMNKSSSYYNNSIIVNNNINNSFNKTQINNSHGFYLNTEGNEKQKIFDYNHE